jgi:hypothetical protein
MIHWLLPESKSADSLIPQSTPEQTWEKTPIIRTRVKLRLIILTMSSFHRSTKPIVHLLIGAYHYDTCMHLCPYTPHRRCHGVGRGQPLTDPSPDTIPFICSPLPTLVVSCPPPLKFAQEPCFVPPTLFVLWLLFPCHFLNRVTGQKDPSTPPVPDPVGAVTLRCRF